MPAPAIRAENLSKMYVIGRAQARYQTLRDTLMEGMRQPFRRLAALGKAQTSAGPLSDRIWALKDVSFEVQHGEVVGIIGRNGAGKSTLLKLLSLITEPTSGRALIYGRVGSLLEVGTGFHPELSGRENIFLNGAILGMTRQEINRKFDEIVAFAEIEQFLDTPVKRYSSGMYVRLAFAVAAHLEPEILLVDEVLAVGDAAFQSKCLGKMSDVAHQGRTVLFVSHNMGAVQRLCSRVILLEKGQVAADGETSYVTDVYLKHGIGTAYSWERSSPSDQPAFFNRVHLTDYSGDPLEYISTASKIAVQIDCSITRPMRNLQLSIGLLDYVGDIIFGSAPQDAGLEPVTQPGRYRATFYLPEDILMAKTYGFRVALWEAGAGVFDAVNELRFFVQEAASLATSTTGGRLGALAIRCKWEVEKLE